MKTQFLKMRLAVLTVLAAAGCILPQIVLAIGQMTQPIIIKDVLRGQEIIETLTLLNSSVEKVIYELKAEGEITDWTSFYKIEDTGFQNPLSQIEVPSQSFLDIKVKFNLPEDLANGTYQGTVAILTIPEFDPHTGQTAVSVRQRVDREVSITLTDKQIIQLETAIIPLKYELAKDEPLQIKVIYDNQGNVVLKPNLQLKIQKDNQTIFKVIFPYPENTPVLKPRQRKTMPLIEWATIGQKNGKYKAEVEIIVDDKVMKQEQFHFYLGNSQESKVIFGSSKFLAGVAFLGRGSLLFGWLIIIGLFLILTGFVIFLKKKHRA